MILVTGATGFLGSQITRTLVRKGKTVRALKRPDSNLSLLGDLASKVEWVDCDILDVIGLEEAFKDVTQVYHAAAQVSFKKADKNKILKINSEGTANLVNAALEEGVDSFLHVSSVAAIGRKHGDRAIDENADWEANGSTTDYALSKYLGEREVWRGQAEGLPIIIINPSTIIGGGFWNRGTARFFPRAAQGIKYYTDGATGFVDVRDVADCAIKLVEEKAFGERFIIAGENSSYRNLFDQICTALDCPKPTNHAGINKLKIASKAEFIKSFFTKQSVDLTTQTIKILSLSCAYDSSKIKQRLKFEFRPLSKTIQETAYLYKSTIAENSPFGILD
ncbi:MAG: dihydroflavonol-4-reductase [Limisphaerales bacterium]|jgi:dihydroflavonol-4-reductase